MRAICSLFLQLVLCLRQTHVTLGQDAAEDYVLRWASSGGGYRAMAAMMGYANLFTKLGLINETLSKFSAISTTSGSTFFSAPFFYSQGFFDRCTTESTADELYDFVFEWVDAWIEGQDDPQPSPLCAPLNENPELQEVCQLLVYYDFAWAPSVADMFRSTSATYGEDSDFPDRKAGFTNVVPALRDTHHLIVIGLAANSIVSPPRPLRESRKQQVVYIGPGNVDRVFAVPISLSYVVDNATTSYQYAVEQESLPFRVKTERMDKVFQFNDWAGFHLFPDRDQGEIYASEDTARQSSFKEFNVPFGGTIPTITQLTAATSAALPSLASRIPSYLAQSYSIESDAVTPNLLLSLDFSGDFTVCTQWPMECSEQDGQFLDGGFFDGSTLASNVGHYHQSENADLTKVMKVIVTQNNFFFVFVFLKKNINDNFDRDEYTRFVDTCDTLQLFQGLWGCIAPL